MRRTALMLATWMTLGGCLEIEPPPPPIAPSTLAGRVLVVGSEAQRPDGAAQQKALRHALTRLAAGESLTREALTSDALTPAAETRTLAELSRAAPLPPLGQKQPLAFAPGELIFLFDAQGRFDAGSLRPVVAQMLRDTGNERVTGRVTSCTMRLFCLVTLDDAAGKRVSMAETTRLAETLDQHRKPGVKTVARNFRKSAFRAPNDPYYLYQWHYDFARLPAAWDITTGDPNLVVAVIDSGLRINHPDIVSRVAQGADLISDPGVAGDGGGRDPDPTDPGDGAVGNGQSSWHGTHVAGTIAAETDNGEGVAGILWQGRVQPVRVLGMNAQGFDFDILSGVAWAVGDPDVQDVPLNQTPARVLNLSLGGPADAQGRQVWLDVIDIITVSQAARYNYPIFVTAAGNENQNVENIVPANIDGVITVGATRYDGQRAEYSNWGATIDVMAPGGQSTVDQNVDGFPDGVLSLFDNDYNFEQGTSMASPHVAGIVALALSVNPSLDQAGMQQLLRTSANPAGTCNEGCGTGHVDAAAAMLAAGGVVTEEPRLAVDVTRVIFQPGDTDQSFHVVNIGGADLSWNADVSGPQASLFSLSPASGVVPAQSTAVLTVNLARGEYAAGSANLTVRGEGAANGQSVFVDLAFNDELTTAQTNLQAVQVSAYRVDPDTGELTLAQDPLLTVRSLSFGYKIEGLAPGQYYVFGVGDDNNDGAFDPQRESFGAWPNNNNPKPIEVEANTEYTGVNFGLSGGFVLTTEGVVGSPCQTNADCTFAPDAECILDWPGGYCSRVCDDGYCGAGATCEVLDCGGPCNVCLSTCTANTQCRASEGFVCDPYGTCTPPDFQ